MNLDEEASIAYEPDDEIDKRNEAVLIEAERQLLRHEGVNGMGMTRTSTGEDAIVVYVRDRQALSRLPKVIRDVTVIGEITGGIRAT